MTKQIVTETKVDNRSLKSYGLKLGDWVSTDFGVGQVVGMTIKESHLNTFNLNKGERLHMLQVKLEDEDIIVGQDIATLTKLIVWMPEKMYNQILADKGLS